ncbi:MAG: sporulation protein YunB [Christensenellaceae bacterium]|jgi:sporulation protein YunB|nr:sporulation protein YunB [Christensenellaceae bacterium]
MVVIKKVATIFLVVVICGAGFFLVFDRKVFRPIAARFAQAKLEESSIAAVQEAFGAEFTPETFRSLTEISYQNGKISNITLNSFEINKLLRGVATVANENLENKLRKKIGIPLGTLSGISILNDRGRIIGVKMRPLGFIKCVPESEFTGAGINQTRHRIKVKIQTSAELVWFGERPKISANLEILLCENIIIGEVPESILLTN